MLTIFYIHCVHFAIWFQFAEQKSWITTGKFWIICTTEKVEWRNCIFAD